MQLARLPSLVEVARQPRCCSRLLSSSSASTSGLLLGISPSIASSNRSTSGTTDSSSSAPRCTARSPGAPSAMRTAAAGKGFGASKKGSPKGAPSGGDDDSAGQWEAIQKLIPQASCISSAPPECDAAWREASRLLLEDVIGNPVMLATGECCVD